MIASAPSQASARQRGPDLGRPCPPAITPLVDEEFRLGGGERVELAAVGVADAVDVGHQDELAGAEAGRDPGRDVVGVDVADDPVLVAGERRDHRHLAADEERVEEVAPQPDDAWRRARGPGSRSAISRPPSTPDRPDGIDAERRAGPRRARC